MNAKQRVLEIVSYRLKVAVDNQQRAQKQFSDFTQAQMNAPYQIKDQATPNDLLERHAQEVQDLEDAVAWVNANGVFRKPL